MTFNGITDLMNSIGITVNITSVLGLTVVIAFLLIIFSCLLWISLRSMKLWYWKINVQVDTLKSIDARMKNVEEGLCGLSIKENVQLEKSSNANPTTDSDSNLNKETEGETEAVDEIDKVEPDIDLSEKRNDNAVQRGILGNVGKSGKIYTVNELKTQIRE